ncbi:Asp23/Gls24 family envelope stress response protein [Quadrisphaera setariae]|uniref:Asp23/Gls24 family envelope stress response protein n=1 Tax=Quadrisphaera setariae TaxID=2593304 RepID=A0A5C8ZG97_9ACTN|nr:Asp23/Gls24 family envelope stress response protein [Quadrisphaera setariae]TXR56121.1 Asp23/Gls24 family envelope stress response protein [Quadrisphaera setariae]
MSSTPTPGPRTSSAGASSANGGRDVELATRAGTTTIADTVVSKIAGIATREVSGVHSVGGGAARAMGSLRERIPGGSTNHSQGISVEVGETQAAVDIDLIAEYGVAIADLAGSVRRSVVTSVQRMTGLEVTEVNIAVNDVHVPSEDDDSSSPDDRGSTPRQTRVQ